MLPFAQLVMRKAPVVGTPHQIYACFQGAQTTSSVTAFARQHRQSFTHGGIEPLNERGIPDRSSARALQQIVRLLLVARMSADE